jgi:hypothetical protein
MLTFDVGFTDCMIDGPFLRIMLMNEYEDKHSNDALGSMTCNVRKTCDNNDGLVSKQRIINFRVLKSAANFVRD